MNYEKWPTFHGIVLKNTLGGSSGSTKTSGTVRYYLRSGAQGWHVRIDYNQFLCETYHRVEELPQDVLEATMSCRSSRVGLSRSAQGSVAYFSQRTYRPATCPGTVTERPPGG